MTNDFKFEIVKHIAVLKPANENGWARELNIVKWNERDAKVDIRDWNADHTKMSKGLTFTFTEAKMLAGYITTMDI